MFRDPESKRPQEYSVKLPQAPGRALLIDPMPSTGGSAAHAIDLLIARGLSGASIKNRAATLMAATPMLAKPAG